MARPALKPLVDTGHDGAGHAPLLDPPSVVAASRLMQEAGESRKSSGKREKKIGVDTKRLFSPWFSHDTIGCCFFVGGGGWRRLGVIMV